MGNLTSELNVSFPDVHFPWDHLKSDIICVDKQELRKRNRKIPAPKSKDMRDLSIGIRTLDYSLEFTVVKPF